YCDAKLPNPFYQQPAFLGTSFYTSPTLSRFQLSRPFPQFNGDLKEQGLNDGATWYNSLQVDYNVRWGKSLNLLADYTFSKLVERWGYNDPYRSIAQEGPYYNDRPHMLKVTSVYELPFGRGRGIGGNVHGFLDPYRREVRSEEHTSELQSQSNLVCRLLLEKKKKKKKNNKEIKQEHKTLLKLAHDNPQKLIKGP